MYAILVIPRQPLGTLAFPELLTGIEVTCLLSKCPLGQSDLRSPLSIRAEQAMTTERYLLCAVSLFR